MQFKNIFSWILRLVAAGLMLQTLWFKFSGAAESVNIFSTIGIEPWGRIATGVAELIAAILLLWPATISLGAALGAAIMSGAIMSHFFILGIEVMDDGGQLFIYALIVFACCSILLWMKKGQLKKFKLLLLQKSSS